MVWGRYDPAFTTGGAEAFRRDLPDVRVAILDAGHFALDTRLDEVVDLTDAFMRESQAVTRKRASDGRDGRP